MRRIFEATMQIVGIKSFSDIKNLKTMNELSAAQRVLLQDIASGKVTDREGRPIQNELNALQKKWQKQAHEASTSADFKALTTIWGYTR
jgi:hypothetical protein